MKFIQYEDGSCDIKFTDEEVSVIKEKQKLHMNSTSLRHFGNNLMRVVVELNNLLPEKDRFMETFSPEVNTQNDTDTK